MNSNIGLTALLTLGQSTNSHVNACHRKQSEEHETYLIVVLDPRALAIDGLLSVWEWESALSFARNRQTFEVANIKMSDKLYKDAMSFILSGWQPPSASLNDKAEETQ